MLRLFEVVAGTAPAAGRVDVATIPAVDIAAGLRGMWD